MAYVLAQANPLATTDTDLYTVPAGKEAIVSTIAICESAGTPTIYRVLLRANGDAATAAHRLIYGVPVDGNDTTFVTVGLALSAGDVITVWAGTGDVTFQAFIDEKDA